MYTIPIHPLLASGALQFAFDKATPEGKATIIVLFFLSLFSWSIILTKARQLYLSRKWAARFFTAYNATRDPLEVKRGNATFPAAPAFRLYSSGATELEYQLGKATGSAGRISNSAFDAVKVVLEEAAGAEAMRLEKGMIVLSTAVAGGPFIGLLGTVWGVMETFAGIARANAATLTAMAPGVAGALIATVVGLLVAIPAMFAYNFMVTSIRAITQELDGFAARYATQIEHTYVDNRDLEDKIVEALQRASRIKDADNSLAFRP